MLDFILLKWYNSAIMKMPGTTTEGVRVQSTMDRQIDPVLRFDLNQFDIALSPEQQLLYDRAGEELKQPHTSELQSGEKRRKFVEYHTVNDTDEAVSTCFVMTGFDQTVRGPLTAHAIQILAATHPEIRYLVPTTPGLDGTDRFPPEILKKLREGSFEAAGEYLLEALRPALDSEKPLDILAYSQGSSFGMGMAAASRSGEIRNVRVIDPASIIRRKLIGMYLAVRATEAHNEEVWRGADEASRSLRGLVSTFAPQNKVSFRETVGGTVDKLIRIPLAMGRACLLEDANTARRKITGNISAVIGELSEYNPISRVEAEVAKRALGSMTLGLFGPAGYHGTIVAKAGSFAAMA